MTPISSRFGLPLRFALLALVAFAEPAWAQAHNPFSVGISEGGGPATGFMGWILSEQGLFERSIAAAVRASAADGSALWYLMGISLLYGILHAAGPGHGKAVLASYMVANHRALKRGIVLSFLASLLQALVAIALVGVLSLVFHATALGMRGTAAAIEKASYFGIAFLGAFLLWRKGRALRSAVLAARAAEAAPAHDRARSAPDLAFAGLSQAGSGERRYRFEAAGARSGPSRSRASAFVCDAAHEHGPGCGHVHAPDPATLGESFSWRESISTVVAAGARPCSGAILVLVFALAQGMFYAGIASTLVMAFGTAITTAALAATAVLAKTVALKLAGGGSRRGTLMARAFEVAAAALVLAVGLSLLFGVGPLQALS